MFLALIIVTSMCESHDIAYLRCLQEECILVLQGQLLKALASADDKNIKATLKAGLQQGSGTQSSKSRWNSKQ